MRPNCATVRRLKSAVVTEPMLLTLSESKSVPRFHSDHLITVGEGDKGVAWSLSNASTDNVGLVVRESDVALVVKPSEQPTVCDILVTPWRGDDLDDMTIEGLYLRVTGLAHSKRTQIRAKIANN